MKRIGFFLMLALIWAGCDKTTDVTPPDQNAPKTVVDAITQRFSSATDLVLTTLQSNQLYAADFVAQSVHYKAIVDQNGAFKNLDAEMPVSEINSLIQAYLNRIHPGGTVGFLYKNLNPITSEVEGYLTQITDPSGVYLVAFDALGGRISMIQEPTGDWWRYALRDSNELPANIRSFVQTAQPLSVFRYATRFTDINQVTTWQVAVGNANLIDVYELDAAANVLRRYTEDLLDVENQQVTNQDLYIVGAVPEEIKNFLNTHFTGWLFERAYVQRVDTTALGFLNIIQFNQSKYYVRFDTNQNFIGANKE